jgi:Transcriptional regulator, AbiEi antitoxin, Type IV TA system/Transcriptional regulator, AbiEi antitoxin N-terminal domain
MAGQKDSFLNRLERDLPEGLVVDAAWLRKRGYSRQLLNHYTGNGWLEQPARGVYQRPRGKLGWQQVVISLQALLQWPLVVGGRTALELQGYAHYLPRELKEVHLYGPKPPPGWVEKLPLDVRFAYHNGSKLFRKDPITRGLSSLNWNLKQDHGKSNDPIHGSWTIQPWGQWEWPLTLSTPERALFELLDELPSHESFHQVDMLMEGLSNLSPRRLQKLLVDCKNVKVKRLFFYFADRHPHAWLKRLDKDAIDLGEGKRMLVKNGKLNKVYLITVPEDMDGIQ